MALGSNVERGVQSTVAESEADASYGVQGVVTIRNKTRWLEKVVVSFQCQLQFRSQRRERLVNDVQPARQQLPQGFRRALKRPNCAEKVSRK